jgi:hypothetical protein
MAGPRRGEGVRPIEIVPPSKEFADITLACIQALRDYEPAKEEILTTLKLMNRPVFLVDKRSGIDTRSLDFKPGLIVPHSGLPGEDA